MNRLELSFFYFAGLSAQSLSAQNFLLFCVTRYATTGPGGPPNLFLIPFIFISQLDLRILSLVMPPTHYYPCHPYTYTHTTYPIPKPNSG